jgi:hypothetical protein
MAMATLSKREEEAATKLLHDSGHLGKRKQLFPSFSGTAWPE